MPQRKVRAPALLIAILGLAEFARGAVVVSLLAEFVTGPLGASLTVVGLAISGHYLFDTIFRGPAGWLVDRVGPPRVLSVGLLIEVFALLVVMKAGTSSQVIVGMALLGVGTSTHWPSVVTGMNRLSGTNRASAMGLVFAAWLVGSGVGPVIVNFLMSGRDQGAFAVLAMADVLALIIALAIKHPRLGRNTRAAHPRQRWPALWKYRAVLPGMFVQNMTLGLMVPILQPYAFGVLSLSHWQFAEMLLGSGSFAVMLLVPMGKLTDRFGVRFPLIGGFFVASVALVALSVLRNFLGVVVSGGVLGLAYSMILPSWNAFLAKMIPKHMEGWMWGVFMTVEGLGMATGPVVGARLFGWGPGVPFLFSAVILAIMGTVYWKFPYARYLDV